MSPRAPTAGNNTVTTDEDVTTPSPPGDFNFADIDGDNLSSVKVTNSNPPAACSSTAAMTLNQVISKGRYRRRSAHLRAGGQCQRQRLRQLQFLVNDGIPTRPIP